MKLKIWLMFNKTKINPTSKEIISTKEIKNGLLNKINIRDFRRGNMRDLLLTIDKVDHQGQIIIMEEVHVKTTTTIMEIRCKINMKDIVMIKIKVFKTKAIKIIVLNSKIKIDSIIPNKSLIIRMLTITHQEKKVFKDIIMLKIMMVKDIQIIIMDPYPHKSFYIAVQVIHLQGNSTTIYIILIRMVKIMITKSINKIYKVHLENIFMIQNRVVVGMVQIINHIKLIRRIHSDKGYVKEMEILIIHNNKDFKTNRMYTQVKVHQLNIMLVIDRIHNYINGTKQIKNAHLLTIISNIEMTVLIEVTIIDFKMIEPKEILLEILVFIPNKIN